MEEFLREKIGASETLNLKWLFDDLDELFEENDEIGITDMKTLILKYTEWHPYINPESSLMRKLQDKLIPDQLCLETMREIAKYDNPYSYDEKKKILKKLIESSEEENSD